MKALIPMAGEGSRFVAAGYTFPKPLIDVNGKPMIQVVVDTLPVCSEYIFLCRKEHIEKYQLEDMLQSITGGCSKVVVVDKLTEGAACTALLAEHHIDNNEPLLIANSDQYVEFDHRNFNILRRHANLDGIVFTFNASHPKWSFVDVDSKTLQVTRVVEKQPISNIATCGIYYWSKGSDFCRYAHQMIKANRRVNGEFYIAPVYQEALQTARFMLVPFFVNKMSGLGTPEDLENFLR
jgi:dTDP-glucose pyrophosphorylase